MLSTRISIEDSLNITSIQSIKINSSSSLRIAPRADRQGFGAGLVFFFPGSRSSEKEPQGSVLHTNRVTLSGSIQVASIGPCPGKVLPKAVCRHATSWHLKPTRRDAMRRRDPASASSSGNMGKQLRPSQKHSSGSSSAAHASGYVLHDFSGSRTLTVYRPPQVGEFARR